MRASIMITGLMAAVVAASPALKVIEEVHTVTAYVTAGQPLPTEKPKPKPANGGGFIQNHPHPQPAPQPKPQPKPQSSQPSTSGNDMLDVANKYRAKYGLPEFSWDESLVPNCEQTGQQGDGVEEKHLLVDGIGMGQVITPGQQVAHGDLKGMSPFEVAYVAWLCEVNTDPELQPSANGGCDLCGVVQDTLTMAYGGETGHHDILVDPKYTKIACAFTPKHGQVDPNEKYQGLYVCDVAN